jgi:hypothetical protein
MKKVEEKPVSVLSLQARANITVHRTLFEGDKILVLKDLVFDFSVMVSKALSYFSEKKSHVSLEP